jgi:integrase
MRANTLTATAATKAKSRDKKYKLGAGGGLYLEVMPTGAKYWRWKYRHGGKEKRLALGVFPQVSLADAREQRDDWRAKLRDGADPTATRRAAKHAATLAAADSFRAVAGEWLATQKHQLAATTFTKTQWMIGLVPALHALPVAGITPQDVLAALRRIQASGHLETMHRVKQCIGQILRFAVATGRAAIDPTPSLRGALPAAVAKSHAALTDPARIGELLRSIHGYSGQPATIAALQLAPLLFVRPGELRRMEWKELDLDATEWRIPAGKMKMREAHIVPLPTQAVAILRGLYALTGCGGYCFPSLRTGDKPISENTVNSALRALGYGHDTMTGHGFRAMASTRLNELGWAPDVIERQLAHAERNKVRAAYNRAQYLAERRRMMQAWADYLDELRAGAEVAPRNA